MKYFKITIESHIEKKNIKLDGKLNCLLEMA